MFLFLMLGLLVCSEPPGSSAVTFVLKGEDVTLDIQKPDIQEGTTFAWRFKSRYNVLRLDNDKVFIFPNYRGRVEFSLEDYSLLLKNLTEADSGVYSALLIGEQDEKVAEYEVTVQERVSPVHLTVKPVSSSSDSCNVTVTCSSQDSSISSTLTCDGEDCSLEGGERSEVTASAASITVYLLNGSVICNHSNQVSWREDRMKIDALCWLHAGKTLTVMNISSIVLTSFFSGPQSPSGVSVCLVKTVVFSVGLIIMVSVVIGVNLLDRLKKKE
ncbi:SLAM family member 9-like isoform X1 [Myripristis murdjan]|uniref:SLAM family member 9-like isoform X1 n=1 Tax=Myripristis murdjan TaxID=586833 RepID=UPI0011762537|nr:SLAM family member 9 isoform X1 [Myripristis murdjan]